MVFKDISRPALVMLNIAIKIIVPFQIVLLHFFYWVLKLYFAAVGKNQSKRQVAIGVTEVARLIYSLGLVFPSRYTCVLDGSAFYEDQYDFGPYSIWLRPIVGPWRLALLSHLCETFIYISFTGYLADRECDLRFLRARGKKIVLLFYGSDIRSLKKTKEFFDQREEDSFVNYLPNLFNDQYDKMIKRTALIADTYANLIFNWAVDQIGYLESKTLPWPYICEIGKYEYSYQPPQDKNTVTVLHCPSHQVAKGTPLVRAVIKKLRAEGYRFNYLELNNVTNSVVLQNLKNSHIVLQEFYSLTPGMLGIEALATGNAVLMSANHEVNYELPQDSAKAWLATSSWQIYDHLKRLLDNPSLIQEYATQGRQFVEKHYDLEKVRAYYHNALSERGIPF